MQSPASFERILGIDFFNGEAAEAIALFQARKGVLLIPSAPALSKLEHEASYRENLTGADMVLLDSHLLASTWSLLSRRKMRSISASHYFRALLAQLRESGLATTLWIVQSEAERDLSLQSLQREGLAVHPEQILVRAPSGSASDHSLLLAIEEARPEQIIVATATGTQEHLACYLRDYLLFKPCIHCVGAALAFLNGSERPVPEWAESASLGWLARLVAQPGMLLPRLGIAFTDLRMLFRYRSELPPLRPRWADV